jgi:hypothetical protein
MRKAQTGDVSGITLRRRLLATWRCHIDWTLGLVYSHAVLIRPVVSQVSYLPDEPRHLTKGYPNVGTRITSHVMQAS